MPKNDPKAAAKTAQSAVLWSGLSALLKLGAGMAGNSLGLTAAGLHNLMGLTTANPGQPGKSSSRNRLNSLGSFLTAVLLFAAAAWIALAGLERLLLGTAVENPSWWPLLAALIFLLGDILLTLRGLQARAIWPSALALAGLACVFSAGRLPDTAGAILGRADAAVALLPALQVMLRAGNLSRKTMAGLSQDKSEAPDGFSDPEPDNSLENPDLLVSCRDLAAGRQLELHELNLLQASEGLRVIAKIGPRPNTQEFLSAQSIEEAALDFAEDLRKNLGAVTVATLLATGASGRGADEKETSE